MFNIDILKELYKIKQDDIFISFQEKIINTKLKVIGVKIPDLRKLAKEILKKNICVEFNSRTDKYFECVTLEGFLISQEKDKQKLKQSLMAYYEKMDNWAVVDMVCSSLGALKKEKTKDDFEYFKSLLITGKPFIVRFGIVGFLKYFSEAKYNDSVLDALNNIKCGDYYVDMAIAWLISEIIIKNPQNALKIMQKIKLINNLNRFIVNKSVQKCLESFRLNKEIKEKLKEMRIK